MSAGKHHFSGERLYYRKVNQSKEPTHQEPIECIKVWTLLGYPSNTPGYPSNYFNYISKIRLGQFPHFSWTPPVDNFFNIHLTKNIIEHKRCRI